MGNARGLARRRRLLAALLLAAAGVAAALALGSYRGTRLIDETGLTSYGSAFVPPPSVAVPYRPGWVEPAAVLIAVLGVGGAAVVIRSRG